mmetsp:Transcript_47463/g.57476  ORF Transcript_47463/g.57476 Transcript_47463/m.57476 type:complete len:110 (-) Transcript_47463:121-450(-)
MNKQTASSPSASLPLRKPPNEKLPDSLESVANYKVFPEEKHSDTSYNDFGKIATSFREYFLHNLEQKLDKCRAHTYKCNSYTLDANIMKAYKSITVQDWLLQLDFQKTE